MIACCQSHKGADTQTAKICLEEAETALNNDSIRLGETLLRKPSIWQKYLRIGTPVISHTSGWQEHCRRAIRRRHCG